MRKKNNQDLNNEKLLNEIESLTNSYLQQYNVLTTLHSNQKILDLILSNTIMNEDGEESCTMKFKDIKSFATYIKAMNDISIEYVKNRL